MDILDFRARRFDALCGFLSGRAHLAKPTRPDVPDYLLQDVGLSDRGSNDQSHVNLLPETKRAGADRFIHAHVLSAADKTHVLWALSLSAVEERKGTA